jgi:diacylglycerol kinase family enzyme
MLLHASVGFHAATIGDTEREAKNRWGVLAYLKEGLEKLTNLEQFQVRIETDDQILQCRAINVMVANAAPAKTVLAQGPAEVVPDDGVLDITIVAATGLGEAVATGLHLLRTAARQEAATRDNVGFLSARRVVVDTDPAQAVLIDGEPAGEGRLVVECLPKSINVLVPAGTATAASPFSEPETKLEGLPDLEVEPKAT